MPLVGWLSRAGVAPDWLTFAAIPTGALIGLALALGQTRPAWLWLVPALAVVRLAWNAMDGLLAQQTGKARPWGEALNELCDRITDMAIFVGLPLGSWLSWPESALLLVLIILIAYIGTLGKAAGATRQYGGPFGKADRTLLLALAAVVVALAPDLPALRWFAWAALPLGLITIGLRLRKIYCELSASRESSVCL